MNQLDTQFTLASAVDAATSSNSIPYQLNGIKEFSIQVVFSSATLNGTLKLQASNDPVAFSAPGSATWVDVASSSQSIVSGASHVWNVTAALYKNVRFVYTASSGTGTLTAYMEVKFNQG